MKKLLTLLLLFAITYGINAQSMSGFGYSEVIQQEGKSSAEIYKTLRTWFARTFVSSNNVIQYDDVNNGITGTARFEFKCSNLTWAASTGYVTYSISLKIKDGRFKMTMDNFVHCSTEPGLSKKWSMGLVYKDLPTNEELKALGYGAMERGRYKAIDKRVRPLCAKECADLFASLKVYLENNKQTEAEDDNW